MRERIQKLVSTSAFVALFSAGVLVNLGSSDIDINPGEGQNTKSIDFIQLIGFKNNVVNFEREFFAGKNVRSFRLKLLPQRLIAGGRTWLENMQVEIFSMPDNSLIQTIDWAQLDGNDLLWTDTIPGNWAKLKFTSVPSNTRMDLGEFGSRIFFKGIEYDWDSSVSTQTVPTSDISQLNQTASADATEIVGFNEGRTIGIMLNTSGKQYHYTTLEPNKRYAVYASPNSPGIGHDVGLSVGMSTTGFVEIQDSFDPVPGEVRPRSDDTGVYFEIEPAAESRTLYLTISAAVGNVYSLSVNEVEKRFPIVYSTASAFKELTPPTIERSFFETINAVNPYGAQLANFVRTDTTYLQRTREMIVLSTANMLAASEGYARQSRADIHQSINLLRSSDVLIHPVNETAFAFPLINLFRSELDNPVDGGAVMHHEWGHYEYGMLDEYNKFVTENRTIDHNSVMGTTNDRNIRRFEFCTDLNHFFRDSIDPTEAGPESNWSIFTGKYGLSNRHNFAQGQYYDVLNKLESMIEFNIVE